MCSCFQATALNFCFYGMPSPHHLTIPRVRTPFCTWKMNPPCSLVSPNTHKAFAYFRNFNEGLERQQSLHESQANYFKAACGASPSGCPQSYSAPRVLPLLAPSFFCSTILISNSSHSRQGSLTFSLVSWSPVYLLALTAFVLAVYQSFSRHTFIP